eukprot:2875749-Rhodomonas_salina.2
MSGPQNLLGYSTSSAMVKLLCVLFVCVSSSAAFVSPNYGLSTIGVGRFSPAVSRANARKEAVFMAAKSKKNKVLLLIPGLCDNWILVYCESMPSTV